MKRVSIVLPTFNEKDSLEKFVNLVLDQQKNLPGHELYIVISDSNSTDGTKQIAIDLAKKHKNTFFLNVGPGLGRGLYEGHLFALKNLKPDILIQLDADGQVLETIIPKLVANINSGHDFAIGSRFVKGGKNKLSITRKIFSLGSSWFCRIVMGPFNIKEFTNSARAFTPYLFKKINWDRLPWKEKSFISQPAFLNEAILAGAKYIEVPLTFRNRAAGYSKNKIVRYTYDIVCYCLDARLSKWGIPLPLFKMSRKLRLFSQ